MSESGKQSPATRNHSSLLSSYGVQRVQKVLRVQRVPVAASPPFWLTVFPYRQPSPQGEGAPKGRIGYRRHEREWGMRLKYVVYESTLSTADAVPLPRWGRLRGAALRADFYKGRCPKVVGIAIRGKRIFNIRGEPTPSRFARQPLPEEGARMWGVLSVSIPPSFGRRCPQGGGWGRRAE